MTEPSPGTGPALGGDTPVATEPTTIQIAQAAQQIGTVTGATGDVTVTHADGSTEALAQGSPIYENDRIVTAQDASVQIEFVDGTLKTFKSVPAEVWRRFVASPNPASFYADRIDEEYPVATGRAAGSQDARGKLDALFGTPPDDSDSRPPT